MKKTLAILLLLTLVVGCGDPVAELEGKGARFTKTERGEVVGAVFPWSRVTDEGLVDLKGLTNLQKLTLTATKITDAGLVHLKGMTNLDYLDLLETKVTDTGLVHLKGLNKLVSLLLPAQVTDAAVTELKKALPNCKILH